MRVSELSSVLCCRQWLWARSSTRVRFFGLSWHNGSWPSGPNTRAVPFSSWEKQSKIGLKAGSSNWMDMIRRFADSPPAAPAPPNPSRRAALKQAVKDYGSTVIVFHIALSLSSLGLFYILVSSGLDVAALLGKIGLDEKIFSSKVTQGASTFVIAYAIHKVFAPVRITVTLTALPFIVKKLRSLGILKTIAKKQ